jgi:hypothetical protein
MRFEIKIMCDAHVYESWKVDLADGLAAEALHQCGARSPASKCHRLVENAHDEEDGRVIISFARSRR